MAKVLLISPPYVDLYGKLNKAAGRYFPLGLGYIASYLRAKGGHEVRMFEPEAQQLSYEDMTRLIKEFAPDYIGLTCSTPNFYRALELAKIGKANSTAKIVMGGVHVSALPNYIIEKHGDVIDYIVVGEGEETMFEFIRAREMKTDLRSVKGLVYKEGGSVISTGVRPYIKDLDQLPPPARDLIPQHLFHPNLHNARFPRCLSILTSRGCPFNCTFCAARLVSGKIYRSHSAEYVLEEMAVLKRDYQAQQLLITDDTFTLNKERVEAICKGMIDRKFNMQWFCFSQVTTVNKEILKLMKRAGCYSIGFGVEAADPEILRKMGKPIHPDRAIEAVRLANEVGMKTQAFYVLGSPEETLDQMKSTIALAEKVNATLSFFNMLVPYPGTKDFEFFFRDIPLDDINWEEFVAIGEKCVLKHATIPPIEIERLIASANKRYYLNPRRLLSLAAHIRTPYELKGYIQGAVAFFRQIVDWSK